MKATMLFTSVAFLFCCFVSHKRVIENSFLNGFKMSDDSHQTGNDIFHGSNCSTMKLIPVIIVLIAIISSVDAAAYVKFDGIEGDSRDENAAFDESGEYWFTNLRPGLSFDGKGGICNEAEGKGSKIVVAGTADINIGVGEVHFTKDMDYLLSPLLMKNWNRKLSETCELCYTVRPLGSSRVFNVKDDCFLHIQFQKCVVKSYNLSEGTASEQIPTEDFSLDFAKVDFNYNPTNDGPEFRDDDCVIWDIKPARCGRR